MEDTMKVDVEEGESKELSDQPPLPHPFPLIYQALREPVPDLICSDITYPVSPIAVDSTPSTPCSPYLQVGFVPLPDTTSYYSMTLGYSDLVIRFKGNISNDPLVNRRLRHINRMVVVDKQHIQFCIYINVYMLLGSKDTVHTNRLIILSRSLQSRSLQSLQLPEKVVFLYRSLMCKLAWYQ